MSGWYPDPTGRFEYRYHNDEDWTADVASGGRRFVDRLPPAPKSAPSGSNGLAVAGMVCGIVAVAIAWFPFIAVLGLIAATVGLALSIPGLARSRETGSRRGFAIAGIVTSALGLVAGAVGIVLTVELVRAVERFDDPPPNDVRVTTCTRGRRDEIVARGQLENRSNATESYSLRVRLARDTVDWVVVEDVAAGATVVFEAREQSENGDEPACRVLSVHGPPPFGLDPELFE